MQSNVVLVGLSCPLARVCMDNDISVWRSYVFLFQWAFAATSTTIVSGAIAERVALHACESVWRLTLSLLKFTGSLLDVNRSLPQVHCFTLPIHYFTPLIHYFTP